MEMEIVFDDLTPEAQQRVLDFYSVDEPAEMNFDVAPLAILSQEDTGGFNPDVEDTGGLSPEELEMDTEMEFACKEGLTPSDAADRLLGLTEARKKKGAKKNRTQCRRIKASK